MPAARALEADALAPLFVLTALIFAAGVASRFDLLAARIPDVAHAALLCAALPLILVTGYFEARIVHGGPAGAPLWMRITSRPLKWALTLGFTYLAITAVQTLDWELGPLDPSPPPEFPPATRAVWFALFSFGMFFANWLATTGVLVPVLRIVTWPARLLPTALGLLLLVALGLALAWFILVAAADTPAAALFEQARSLLRDPVTGALATAALAVVPAFLGVVLDRRRD
jgi:hypothetical protein